MSATNDEERKATLSAHRTAASPASNRPQTTLPTKNTLDLALASQKKEN
jgi:hypothetical protein